MVTYQATGTSGGLAERSLPGRLGSQFPPQALVVLGELLHLGLQTDLRQLQPIDAAAQLFQLLAEPPLGGALLPQPAGRLVPLALAALGPGPQRAQLRSPFGGAPDVARAGESGAAGVRGVQLGQQEAGGATEAPHVQLQPLHLRPQDALLLAHQAQLAPLDPPAALQGRSLPPQRRVLAPQPLPQPPQPPPLPLGRALVLSNLRVGGGGGRQEGGPGSHRACLYLKLRYFVVQRAFSFRISFCIKILLRILFISMTVTGALLNVAQDASAFLQVPLSSKDKDSGKLSQDGDGLVHTQWFQHGVPPHQFEKSCHLEPPECRFFHARTSQTSPLLSA